MNEDISDLEQVIDQIIAEDAHRFAETHFRMHDGREMTPPENYIAKYGRWRSSKLNRTVLETYGHRLSEKAQETAWALANDGWTLGPYELLIAAQRLAKG